MPAKNIWLEGHASDRTAVSVMVKIDPVQVALRRGTHGRMLVLPCHLDTKLSSDGPQPTLSTSGIAKVLSIAGWIGGPGGWGTSIPVQYLSSLGGTDVEVLVPFDDAAVATVEQGRGDTQLVFHVQLDGLVQVFAQPDDRAPGGSAPPRCEMVACATLREYSHTIEVQREQWLRMLGSVGPMRYLIELPTLKIPDPQQHALWDEAVRCLVEADRHFRLGEHAACFRACRPVVEAVVTILGQQWAIPAKPRGVGAWAEALSPRLASAWGKEGQAHAESIGALLKAGWVWTREAPHFRSRIPDRGEASFTLHLVQSLLAFAAEILTQYPGPIGISEAEDDPVAETLPTP